MEKQEFTFKTLRQLSLALIKLLLNPKNRLGAPVYVAIFPDGEIFIE